MKYKVIGTRGMVPFEISGEMIDDFIKRHCYAGEIQWREYLLDESGNMCGLKGLADSGHGYGFNYGWEEFTINSVKHILLPILIHPLTVLLTG